DHRPELGELARELHIGLGRELAGELGLHRLVAGDQRVEFLFRQHGGQDLFTTTQICSPCSAAKVLSRSRIGTLPAGLSISGAIRVAALPASRSISMAFTGPTAVGDSENERYPIAASASAPIG